jgi:hypothetical protein
MGEQFIATWTSRPRPPTSRARDPRSPPRRLRHPSRMPPKASGRAARPPPRRGRTGPGDFQLTTALGAASSGRHAGTPRPSCFCSSGPVAAGSPVRPTAGTSMVLPPPRARAGPLRRGGPAPRSALGVEAVDIQLPMGSRRVVLSRPGWSLGKETLPGPPRTSPARCSRSARPPPRAVRWACPASDGIPPRGAGRPVRGGLALLRPARAPRGSAAGPAPQGRPGHARGPAAPARGQHPPPSLPAGGARPGARRPGRPRWSRPTERRPRLRPRDGRRRLGRKAPAAPAHPRGRRCRSRRTARRRDPQPALRLRAAGRETRAGSSAHDGAALDPVASPPSSCSSSGSSGAACERSTRSPDASAGRSAPRGRELHLALAGVTGPRPPSESGVRTGLDLHDGTVRFRVAAPCPSPVRRRRGARWCSVPLGREDRSGAARLDPVLGEVRWLTELPFRWPRLPTAGGAPRVDRRLTRIAPPSPASTSVAASCGSGRSPVP